ncbi:MAG: alkaline phosphatase family protein [Cyanobacteriota bacterium]|nr:alkaline phosphatase family protein [Cyanobacteriota bacterium]
MSPKVLLLGWDAADWKVMAPLMDAGRMPNLARLASNGVVGNLSTLYPVLSPMLWTSIATGKRAHKHGIHGFSEPDPVSGGVRPITNLGRRTKAIWNILQQNGLKSNLVGWWPSHPVEPISGVMVSNHYQQMVAPVDQPWPMRAGTVHPPHLIEPLADLRIHPADLKPEMLLPFIPRAAEIDQRKDFRLASVAKVLAETASVHAAATALIQLEPWDFMGVYFDGIDHLCHGFMKYHPPRLEWVPEADFELYNEVVNAGYQFHDMMLGTYLQLIDDDTTVMIVSDHGFHPDHLRPREIPNEPAGPADEHRQFGMVAMMGPRIRQGEQVFGASLLDITPTILSLFDLPVGADMDGRPLISAFRQPVTIQTVPSWDSIAGDAGLHPPGMQIDPVDQHAALQQLVELGYIDHPDENLETAAALTLRELRYNLARDLLDAGRVGDAVPLFEELWDADPDEGRFGVHLLQAQLSLGRPTEAEATLERLVREKQRSASRAIAQLEALQKELQENGRQPEDLSDAERQRLRRLHKRAGTNIHAFAFLRGRIQAAQGRHREAIESFEQAREVQLHNRPSLHQHIAESHLALGELDQAEREFHAMRAIDPINAACHLGLARVHSRRGDHRRALDQAIAATGLLHNQPQAHFLCARSLAALGRSAQALNALQLALDQSPVYPAAHRLMARLQRHQGNLEEAREHRLLARASVERLRAFRRGDPQPGHLDLERDLDALLEQPFSLAELSCGEALPPHGETAVVVSGLPRSGTSMLMQMLAAGGLELLSDGRRDADASNPRGYQEFEPVKSLGRAPAVHWIEKTRGKAVKVVSPLLPHLPADRPYRIVFAERPLGEVLASQAAMLEQQGKATTPRSQRQLAAAYLQQLERLRANLRARGANVQLLSLSYRDAIASPAEAAARLNRFLGGGLDETAMASAIDPALHRQRLTQPAAAGSG